MSVIQACLAEVISCARTRTKENECQSRQLPPSTGATSKLFTGKQGTVKADYIATSHVVLYSIPGVKYVGNIQTHRHAELICRLSWTSPMSIKNDLKYSSKCMRLAEGRVCFTAV